MKTKIAKHFLMYLSSGVIALLSICIVISITNCSKKNNDQLSNSSKLKMDTIKIKNLPPQDSLNLIKNDFGQGILTLLQQNFDATITDFNILSDTIVCNNDSIVAYTTTISCKGIPSKQVGIKVNLPDKKKSTAIWVIDVQICICLQSSCQCNCCQLLWSGQYHTCLCTQYGDCQVRCTTVPIILW
jgi:hypothetical protein